jgi:nicotinamidase-related amidase
MVRDLKRTAVVIADPQNDLLSEGGVVRDPVGDGVRKTRVVEHLAALRNAAKELEIPVIYSPHHSSDEEYERWAHLNPIDRIMCSDRKMFRKGTWEAEFHPDLEPDENTIVLSPHKALSNSWTGDINLQLRQRNVQTVILAGMSANLCVESHLRDVVEHGFEVIVVKDATTGPGPEATRAACTNYGFIANEIVSTGQIVSRLREGDGGCTGTGRLIPPEGKH